MLTIDTVLGWTADSVDLVSDALVAHRSTLLGLQDELDDADPSAAWPSGTAADFARTEHLRLANDLGDLVAEVAMVVRALDLAAASVRAARLALEGALSYATTHQLVVNRATGTVTDSVCLPGDVADFDRMLLVAECADLVEQALRSADHADGELAAALLLVHDGTLEGGATLADSSTLGTGHGDRELLAPPATASETDNRAWWDGLPESEQARVLTEHPEWVGNADGIPASVRHAANVSLLDDRRSELEAKVAELEETPWVFGGLEHRAQIARYKDKIAALDAIEETLALGDRQLLLLDTTGYEQVRAAVAIGDVDTADHVAVFTPGHSSNVEHKLVGYDAEMQQLRDRALQESERYGSSETVATVTWIGYEAPQWDGLSRVMTDAVAREGAADLAGFYRGIDASRDSDPHLTALGHSYGSTTTGFALQEPNGVDDAVIFGSCGLGVEELDELDVSGNVYRVEARWDAVADLGAFGADPSDIEGITGLDSREVVLGGEELSQSTGHSAYLVPGSTSQHNMAAVIVGSSDRLVTAP